MAETYEVDRACPVCGGTMLVTRLSCPQCSSALEGSFRLRGMPSGPLAGARMVPPPGPRVTRVEAEARFGRLARLDAAQLDFVEAFLRCRGVIKNVEDMLGISYPTVKTRLAEVLGVMGFGPEADLPDGDRRRARREILADLAAGRISTEEAHRLLGRGQSGSGEDAE
jgi:hypothetical protein